MKKSLLIFCFLLLHCNNAKTELSNVRKPAVAGAFYPSDSALLCKNIDEFLKNTPKKSEKYPAALISPHAGYIYSGPTAAFGYKLLAQSDYKTVIILGPAHYVYVHGASIANVDFYQTPLGIVPLSKKAKTLLKEKGFSSVPMAESQEHSIEVQVPFLQRVLKNFEIIPIVVGEGYEKEIAEALLKNLDESTLIIASSDLSHYHSYEEAIKLDRMCIKTIENIDVTAMEKQEACGKNPIKILLRIAKAKAWLPKVLDYRNSGDTAGDKTRVVGYVSIAFFAGNKKEVKKMSKEISPADQKFLLELARKTIIQYLNNGSKPEPEPHNLSQRIREEQGAFVTLHKKGALRGCIGYILPRGPLYQAVIDNAINAAFSDPRFPAVTSDEINDLHIEISALTKPQRLEFASPEDLKNKLRPLIDGVILNFGEFRQSTFLPQVWEQLKEKENFLSNLCSKAGMPSDAWKKPGMEVEVYQAQVFKE